MKSPARVLLDKLHHLDPSSKLHSHSKSSDRISADKALSDFKAHLDWLISRHISKKYSEQYNVSGCFSTTRLLKNKNEINAYCRVHLSVAAAMFDDLLVEIRGKSGKISHRVLRRYKEVVRDYIFDLKPLVEYLEQQKDPDYKFFHGAKSYGVHTWDMFRLSRQLAVQSAFRGLPFHVDHKAAQIASIFVLRQALEAKFERLVAVHIYNSSHLAPRLKYGFHYEFIAANPSYFAFKAINFSLLKQVYAWCNDIVHRVYQPYAWQITYAHSICKGFFVPIPTAPDAAWSINNAVEISSLSAMQNAFIMHFVRNYHHGIWAFEEEQPEADVK